MRTFLAEFESLHAAAKHLNRSDLSRSQLSPVVLISPSAQEYLQPASPARDPDTMLPSINGDVRLPGWKLLFRSSRPNAGVDAEEISTLSEKSLQKGVKNFSSAVRERHRNAMIIRVRSAAADFAAVLTDADMIASDHSFIYAAVAHRGSVTLAFVPLTVDPPAAMHYADVISQLTAKLEARGRLRIITCPSEARRYLPPQALGAISSVFQAIRRRFRRHGDTTR